MANQKVLITAGASGIGRAMAHAFAKAGARGAVLDIDEIALNALAPELPGGEIFKFDVSNLAELQTAGPGPLQHPR